MTPERFRRVRDLANAALDRPQLERAGFLAGACEGDDGLRSEVDSLLAAYDEVQGQGFLEAPPVLSTGAGLAGTPDDEAAEGTFTPGQRLGAYEIVGIIGRGGMGVVYRAVRADDEYRQVVAIKVMRRGLDTALGQRRFREERQILATLEHPGIARLLDGGTTADGRPYLVMEHVDGEAIDDYCDRRRLGVAERLRLFVGVCAAVHYAHRSLVVHRDLKPGNVLVTADGVPKLLDFGIARLVQPPGLERIADPTVTALRMLTPDYASPEQVRGEPVTTATDVYSLGVLLYELMSGHRPYKATLVHEVMAAICDQDPERPSASVGRTRRRTTGEGTIEVTPETLSGARGMTPILLRRKLAGDLDTIILKALRKAPAERYASVEAFADDVRRHLDGRPVQARPQTLAYRAGKFVRRNPAAMVAAGLAVAALLGGTAATARQARAAEEQRQRAERRFADVRKLANGFLFEFHDAIKDLPGATTAREMVVRRGLEYLDSLAGEAHGDAALQLEVAAAYEKVGDLQGALGAANLGQTQAALQSYAKALELRESVSAAASLPLEAQRELAMVRKKLASLRMAQGDWAGAIRLFEEVLAFHSSLAAQRPDDAAAQVDRAGGHVNLGIAQGLSGRRREGLANCDKGLAALERLSAADPRNVQLKGKVGVACIWVGNLAAAIPEERPRALAAFRQSIALYEELAAAEPENAFWRHKVGDGYLGASEAYGALGRWSEALEAARKGQSIYAALEAADPRSAHYTQERVALQVLVARALLELGGVASAGPLLVDAERAIREMHAAEPDSVLIRERLAVAQDHLGRFHQLSAGRARGPGSQVAHWRAAVDWLRKAEAHYAELAAQGRLPMGGAEPLAEIRRRITASEAALAGLTSVPGRAGELRRPAHSRWTSKR